MAQRANLVGDVFRSILPLLNMMDGIPIGTLMEAVAGDDGLADCDVSALDLPKDFAPLDRPTWIAVCEGISGQHEGLGA